MGYMQQAWREEATKRLCSCMDFMPNAIVPYNELLGDVHTSLLKDSKRVVCI
jgi:hypothetical protein